MSDILERDIKKLIEINEIDSGIIFLRRKGKDAYTAFFGSMEDISFCKCRIDAAMIATMDEGRKLGTAEFMKERKKKGRK